MYTATLDNVAPKGYTENPDLPGTSKLKEKAAYIVRITEPGEFYDSVTDTGATLGKTFKLCVQVEQALAPNGLAQAGVTYQMRITKFEVMDHQDPAKSSHQRAARSLRSLIAAVSGYSEAQLDSSPGSWKVLQEAFLSGQMTGRSLMVTAAAALSRSGNNYTKLSFSPLPPQVGQQ